MTHSANSWPYSQIPTLVISNSPLVFPESLNITQVTGDASTVAQYARQAAKERDVWLAGGGKTAAWFADTGELQQLFITAIPVFWARELRFCPSGSRPDQYLSHSVS